MNWKILNHPLGISGSIGIPTKKEVAWVPIVMALASLAASGYGAKKSLDAAKKANDDWWREKSSLEAERRKKMNQSWIDTKSGQNTLRILQQNAQKAIRATQGAAAVGGGTDAAVAIEKELQNQKQADVIAEAEANHEQQVNANDAQYRQEIDRINGNIQQSNMAQADATSQVAGAMSDALKNGAVMAGSPGGGGVTPLKVPPEADLLRIHKNYMKLGAHSPLYNAKVFWGR